MPKLPVDFIPAFMLPKLSSQNLAYQNYFVDSYRPL